MNHERFGGLKRGHGGGRDRDRESQGRFVSDRGSDYRGDWEQERDRDSMGRFTSEYDSGSGRYGRGSSLGQGDGGLGRGMGVGGDMSETPRTRSDERIREEVSDRLEQDGDIDAREIEVKAQNGLVTLSGSVESRYEKHMAEQLAEDCGGVKDVQNLIKVGGWQNEFRRQTGSNENSDQTGSRQSDQKQHGRKTA